jgi:CRISPR-associated protein Cmr5
MSAGELWQRRASHALAKAQEVGEGQVKLYGSYVERLGPAVLVNGLGQALASELSASGDGEQGLHGQLARALAGWLKEVLEPGPPDSSPRDASGLDVLGLLCKADQATYARAQQEALEWLDWHKRLVKARSLGSVKPELGGTGRE